MTGVTSIHGWPIFQRLSSLVPAGRLFGIRPPQMKIPDYDNVVSVCMTDVLALAEINAAFRPTHVIHAAGVCDLDICEERPRYAHDINVIGAKNIVDVFDGIFPCLCFMMNGEAASAAKNWRTLSLSFYHVACRGYITSAVPVRSACSILEKRFLKKRNITRRH